MDELHIFVYGEIGGGLFDEGGPSVEAVQKEIQEHPSAKEIVVHISSPGGSVWDGWTIGNIIKNTGKKTTAKIEGLCASIATFIALSCDRVEMAETARFMIHNPTNGLEGEEEDLKEAAKQLATIKDDLVKVYKDKTGLSVNELSKMMDEETFFNATEAKEKGFIDEFMTPLQAVAYYKNKMSKEINKEPGKFQKAVDAILEKSNEILKALSPGEAQNILVSLADGTQIFVDSEDGEFEGKAVWTVDEEGNRTETPVEDGTYNLDDGRSITVEDGMVASVQEAPAEVDLLKDQVKALEAQIAEAQKNQEAEKKETEEAKSQVLELVKEVKNLKKLTVGDKEPLAKRVNEPTNKFSNIEPDEGHPLDAFAAQLKTRRKSN